MTTKTPNTNTPRPSEPVGRYNRDAVESAIKGSRKPIKHREAMWIHALLKGHQKQGDS